MRLTASLSLRLILDFCVAHCGAKHDTRIEREDLHLHVQAALLRPTNLVGEGHTLFLVIDKNNPGQPKTDDFSEKFGILILSTVTTQVPTFLFF
jgi:hypothetical protein